MKDNQADKGKNIKVLKSLKQIEALEERIAPSRGIDTDGGIGRDP